MRTQEQIKAIQVEVGTEADGRWGSHSIASCQRYLRGLTPSPNPWPESDQGSLRAFYGRAGDEDQLVGMPIPDGVIVKYEGKQVQTIRCHRKVAASLGRALVAVSKVAPGILLQYAGCFNNRSIRGGSSPSLHAYGAAIDFDPDNNGNHQHWPTSASMPIEVMECFAKEGWLSAGAFWSRDAMHFQATR